MCWLLIKGQGNQRMTAGENTRQEKNLKKKGETIKGETRQMTDST